MDNIDKLAELFKEFPGIGKRQARRFVYFLLHKNPSYIKELITKIETIQQDISQCSECFRFFPQNGTPLCSTCREHGESDQLLIIEKDTDFETIQKSGFYEGKYFILGGFIQSNEKKRSFARVEELVKRIEYDLQQKKLKEVIFALSLNPEGEHTRMKLSNILHEKFPELTFSTLGRGLSSGTELEYSDSETLKYAFQSRIKQ